MPMLLIPKITEPMACCPVEMSTWFKARIKKYIEPKLNKPSSAPRIHDFTLIKLFAALLLNGRIRIPTSSETENINEEKVGVSSLEM